MTLMPRRHPEGHVVLTNIAKVFWTLVIAVLTLLIGGLVLAPGQLLESPGFVLALVACIALWAVHSVEVHSHRDADRHDPANHRARERRGF